MQDDEWTHKTASKTKIDMHIVQRKWLRVKEHATIETDCGRDPLDASLRMICEKKHAKFIKQEKETW